MYATMIMVDIAQSNSSLLQWPSAIFDIKRMHHLWVHCSQQTAACFKPNFTSNCSL